MQIPILSGIYSNSQGDFRTSYPRNYVPVPKKTGISEGYIKPSEGIVQFGPTNGPGIDRGGINWNNECYRVMGSKLVKVDSLGTITIIGDVGNGSNVSFDYSFDYLAVASNKNLFLYNGATLTQVTDADLGDVIDIIFVDGYFMTTDGEFLVVNELNDPFAVNPLKYGTSEIDPDPVVALKKINNEPHAINRYTIEAYQNIGGDFFPFQRIQGAQIEKGAIGTNAVCIFSDRLAFVGGGRNESLAVYVGLNSQVIKISSREIDIILTEYDLSILEDITIESRVIDGHDFLYIHLPNRSLVYDINASSQLEIPVWHILTSGLEDFGTYRARNFVFCYNKWITGDPTSSYLGAMKWDLSTHFGEAVAWEFGVQMIYNVGKGVIFNSLELIGLPGRVNVSDDPVISTEYSLDGQSWSMPKQISAGKIGATTKRIVWFRQGKMRNYRTQRFRGVSDSHMSIARLEAEIEPLYA